MFANSLEELNQKLEANFSTLPLVNQKSDLIFGEGKIGATIMLIGEAPGLRETIEKRPFVGRSGQLLRQTLTQVGLDFENIYISNIVKARPPDNRDPSLQEIAAYKPYLDAEIKIIRPKLIVTLGRFSLNKFLPKVKISMVHGQLHEIDWQGEKMFILPMYHPAAALRGTRIKNQFVSDFEKIAEILHTLH